MLFHKKERGQGMVEYALIMLLIALAIILALTFFGEQLASTYSFITSKVGSTIP